MRLPFVFRRAALIVLSLWASACPASTIFVNPVAPIAGPYTYSYPQVGYFFTANASGSAQVNELGYEDTGAPGLTSAHDVGLYHWGGSDYVLLAKATVPAGTAARLEGGYRWVSIPTITLSDITVPDRYALVASYDGIDPTYEGTASVTNTAAGLTLGNVTGNGFAVNAPIGAIGSHVSGGSLAYQWGGVNMGFAVPEPAGLLLAVMGAIGVGVLRRRARSFGAQ